MDVPEPRHRRRQLEVIAEASETRLMRQPIDHQSDVFRQWLSGGWSAHIEALVRPAFLAGDVYEHWQQRSGRVRPARVTQAPAADQTVTWWVSFPSGSSLDSGFDVELRLPERAAG